MKLLIVSDFHGFTNYYRWLLVHVHADVVILAGDLIDLFRGRVQVEQDMRLIERCIQVLESQGISVFLAQGNHDAGFGWPWLTARLGLHVTPHLVVYSQPWRISRDDLQKACEEGRREADQRGVPFLVVVHAPPAFTPVSSMAEVEAQGTHHAVDYQPDFCCCGHIHSAPFDLGGSWHYRQGKTWVFNPGCDADTYIPSHIILDLEKREACFSSVWKIERLPLD